MARKSTGEVLELPRKGGRAYAIRFYAYGKRRYITLGSVAEGWTRWRAEEELANVLADVRRGIWKPPKALKVRGRELGLVKRPLSNVTINKTLTRLGQILDVAVRYELIDNNPVKMRVEKLKEDEPRRARLTGGQVQVLLRAAGSNRA